MALSTSARSLLAIVLGLGLQGLTLYAGEATPALLRSGLGLVSGALCVYGTSLAAARKGYSPWLGFAGLLSILGVGAVLLLPPRDVVFGAPGRPRVPQPDRIDVDARDE